MKIEELSKKSLSIILAISLILNILLLFWVIHLYTDIKSNEKEFHERLNEFDLISPEIAWLDTNSFLEKQKYYTIQYTPLKNQLIKKIDNSKGYYGLYFEDLNTGAYIGINEKEMFIPQSLFKVPLMVAILKKVQNGEIILEDKVFLSKQDLDPAYGTLYKKGIGYSITVKELLIIMIKESDNTAMNALSNNFINREDYLEVLSVMGLPESKDGSIYVSPKEYSNIFRSLYFSNYLKRTFSELALSIMLETDFKDQLSAGIPKNVKISHKFGVDNVHGIYHDCGVIYLPEKHYLLCIMSKNNTQQEANLVISDLSKIVYTYMSQQNSTNL